MVNFKVAGKILKEKIQQFKEKIENLTDVEPLTFPFIREDIELRSGLESEVVDAETLFSNCHSKEGIEVKVPKVVE